MADNDSKKPTRDVDDISLDDARPARKSGKGGVVLVLILLIIGVVLIWYIFATQKKKAEEAAAEKRQREVTRQVQVDQAKKNLQLASDMAAAEDIDGAISKLKAADAMLGNVISAANTDGDTEAATALLAQKKTVSDALSAMEGKWQDLKTVSDEQFGLLRQQFGLTAPAPAAETPAATTPEGTAPEATPEATTPPAAPPEASPPPAGEAAPAAPVPPPAAVPAN